MNKKQLAQFDIERFGWYYKDKSSDNCHLYTSKVKKFISTLLREQRNEMKRLNKLADKYAQVIAMVYDGEEVEEAEKNVGLR